MNKVRVLLWFLLMATLCVAAGAAFADEPSVSVGERWANVENARPTETGEVVYRCGTDERGRGIRFTQEEVDRWLQENRIEAGGVIPVYVHVIRTSSEGNVSDADIAQQILVLNRNYAGRYYDGSVVSGAANTGYTFQLAGTDRTTNSKWFRMTPGSRAETQAKNALAINPASALNLYICKPGQNLLGWAVFPWDSRAGGNQDGVVIHYGSLPNGYLAPFNLGGTAPHEVGHYLGLLHTFQGGCDTGSCSTTGDNVCDTPAEATATSGCPAGKNTCAAPGDDPIHNYMDYSSDACYNNFTAGQDTRMNMIVTAAGSKRAWVGATRFALGDGNKQPPSNGEMMRCATPGRPADKPVDVPDMAQVQKWIEENRISAGGVIPVNFHVIYSGATGNVPESQLDAQIAVLNNNFAGKDYDGNPVPGAANTGYTFFKNSVTRTNNSSWFAMTPGSSAERAAKRSLAVNYTSTLNLYTANPGGGLLGWATFPSDLKRNKSMDGVVVHYGSLPGGFAVPFDLGGTATHEVGHWVGLYHTFQGGCGTSSCTTTGDLICDTPAEATATSGCPAGKNTCALPGDDPIHNYMDYSDDACYDNFTAGQDARADVLMSTYRPLIGSARLPNGTLAVQSARDLNGGLVDFAARPNPFNPRTKIEFGMREAGRATVRIFDVRGRLVRTLVDRDLPAGNHSVDFDADGMASGIYLMALSIRGEDTLVKRITLMK